MANHATYKRQNGDLVTLKLTAGRAVELEDRLGYGINEGVGKLDNLKVSVEFLTAAITEGTYNERKETAIAIFDEMVEDGKNFNDYEFLIMDMLVAAGFLRGEVVDLQKMTDRKMKEKASEVLLKASNTSSPEQSPQE